MNYTNKFTQEEKFAASRRRLEIVIENRLSMQSTQRSVGFYGVICPTINYIKSKQFLTKYLALCNMQRDQFLITLAGQVNIKAAYKLMDFYIENSKDSTIKV